MKESEPDPNLRTITDPNPNIVKLDGAGGEAVSKLNDSIGKLALPDLQL
jgi:hypothetical protein